MPPNFWSGLPIAVRCSDNGTCPTRAVVCKWAENYVVIGSVPTGLGSVVEDEEVVVVVEANEGGFESDRVAIVLVG